MSASCAWPASHSTSTASLFPFLHLHQLVREQFELNVLIKVNKYIHVVHELAFQAACSFRYIVRPDMEVSISFSDSKRLTLLGVSNRILNVYSQW